MESQAFGIPTPASGTSAVVFKVGLDRVDQALRFFVRDGVSNRAHYDALQKHLSRSGLRDLVAMPRWLDDAIRVDGRTLPAVRMEWIDGWTLDSHVGRLVDDGDTTALRELATSWRECVRRIQSSSFAHGDLQHGNILIDASGAIRLIDFDGSWTPEHRGLPAPTERGHPNYQRADQTWGRWMDTLPALVVYCSLLVLSRRPVAWPDLHSGDNLLFTRDDLTPPFDTATWRLLRTIEDPAVVDALARLEDCCGPHWVADGPLEELLGREWTPVGTGPTIDPPVGESPRPEARPGPDPSAVTVAEGWFADRTSPSTWRWWDGQRWTERTWQAPKTIFISYARADRERIDTLVRGLRAGGMQVWHDDQLSGGDEWWTEIVQRIQQAAVFVRAASDRSRASRPCQIEAGYAEQLGLPILPVQVGPIRSKRTWPAMQRQMIDFQEPDPADAMRLATAVLALQNRRTLNPDPLPPPPTAPFEYLHRIPSDLSQQDLPRNEQRRILDELRMHLDNESDPEIRQDICSLLRELADHPDAVRFTITDVEATLSYEREQSRSASNPE